MPLDPFKKAFYGPFFRGWTTIPPDRFKGHTGDSVRQKTDPQARDPILSATYGVGSNIPAPFSVEKLARCDK